MDASDKRQVRAAEKRAKLQDQNDREVVASLLETAPGRAWLWRKLEAAHIFVTSFSNDSLKMAFVEGERNSGIILLNQILSADPEGFITMIREANDRRTERDTIDRANGDAGDYGTDEDDAGSGEGNLADYPADRTN